LASRQKQKEEARARRVAEEQARTEKVRRERRLRMLGGMLVVVVAIVAVAIAISSSGGGNKAIKTNSAAAQQAASQVASLLGGIPQSSTTLGNPNASVTVTEFGDLKCPVCQSFALGPESQIISNYVRTGKAKIVYRSLCTATCNGPQPSVFKTEQTAAYAAGLQGKAWDYIYLFYHLQGDETTSYVNASYLDSLARLIPGLNYNSWRLDSNNPSLAAQVTADQQAAAAKGFASTPTVVISGPKGTATPLVGGYAFSSYQSEISSVE
jgi:protein-disulfide isomerase